MTMPDTRRYLDAADRMLSGTGRLGVTAVAGGWWPKACACLIRLALETAITAYWQQANPAVAQYGNWRTKLLLLRRRLPGNLARQTTYTWATLSRATHHHCYETAPSAAELRQLVSEATTVITELIPAGAASVDAADRDPDRPQAAP